jgi:aerobic-type carbon monoxide dehydrogenase small subunit (CoxS/CutS family)
MTLAIETNGSFISTVEGLQQGDNLEPLQNSFVSHDAIQCGYCTSGMLMSTKALLNSNPSPSIQEIKKALSGNLCRCGAYKKIIEAVMEVA